MLKPLFLISLPQVLSWMYVGDTPDEDEPLTYGQDMLTDDDMTFTPRPLAKEKKEDNDA